MICASPQGSEGTTNGDLNPRGRGEGGRGKGLREFPFAEEVQHNDISFPRSSLSRHTSAVPLSAIVGHTRAAFERGRAEGEPCPVPRSGATR